MVAPSMAMTDSMSAVWACPLSATTPCWRARRRGRIDLACRQIGRHQPGAGRGGFLDDARRPVGSRDRSYGTARRPAGGRNWPDNAGLGSLDQMAAGTGRAPRPHMARSPTSSATTDRPHGRRRKASTRAQARTRRHRASFCSSERLSATCRTPRLVLTVAPKLLVGENGRSKMPFLLFRSCMRDGTMETFSQPQKFCNSIARRRRRSRCADKARRFP